MLFDTRGVLSLGTVSADNNGGAEADYQIKIDYEVVFVSMDGRSVDSEFWTSVGMEYDDGNFIWISLISYTLKGTTVCTHTYTDTVHLQEYKYTYVYAIPVFTLMDASMHMYV